MRFHLAATVVTALALGVGCVWALDADPDLLPECSFAAPFKSFDAVGQRMITNYVTGACATLRSSPPNASGNLTPSLLVHPAPLWLLPPHAPTTGGQTEINENFVRLTPDRAVSVGPDILRL